MPVAEGGVTAMDRWRRYWPAAVFAFAVITGSVAFLSNLTNIGVAFGLIPPPQPKREQSAAVLTHPPTSARDSTDNADPSVADGVESKDRAVRAKSVVELTAAAPVRRPRDEETAMLPPPEVADWRDNEPWGADLEIERACSEASRSMKWKTKPQPSQIEAYYPPRALADKVESKVLLKCLVDIDGNVSNCRSLYEEKSSYKFAEYAIELSKNFSIFPASGRDYRFGDSPVCIPIDFRLP